MSRCATTKESVDVNRSAVLSGDGRYRYALHRQWNATKPTVLFIGLNPSTADHRVDDRTIRRCVQFARSWGFGQLAMANLFALRTSSPRALRCDSNPVGPRNDRWIRQLIGEAEEVVVAWGDHGAYLARDRAVLAMLVRPRCLGLSKLGHPRHPLYLRGSTMLRDLDHRADDTQHCEAIDATADSLGAASLECRDALPKTMQLERERCT